MATALGLKYGVDKFLSARNPGPGGPKDFFSRFIQYFSLQTSRKGRQTLEGKSDLCKIIIGTNTKSNGFNAQPPLYSKLDRFCNRAASNANPPSFAVSLPASLNMDAQAYLMRHGWSGPGTPLNPNQRPGPHGGLGLTRPILVARKQNNHGVGKKTTKDPTNQWWLRGFEDALKGVGDDSYEATSARSNNALTSELYRHFVRGTGLSGTINEKKTTEVTKLETKEKSKSKSKRKRDSDEEDSDRRVRKEEKAARKEEKRKRRKVDEDTTESSEASGLEKRKESKEERRARRKAKKEEKEIRKELKKSKKLKRSAPEEDYPTPLSTADTTETDEAPSNSQKKEEKRERKKSKKESRESDSKKKDKKEKIDRKSSTTA
ncbi:unnamed protein product [Penicillium pancosmium]